MSTPAEAASETEAIASHEREAFVYSAYTLTVESDRRLLELPSVAEPSTREPDVTIQAQALMDRVPAGEREQYHRAATEHEVLFFFPKIGAFLIEAGHRIRYEAAPEVEEPMLRQALITICLSTLLHQRGHLVLHASAVQVGMAPEAEGGVVAFVGEKGQGKSTMAAALCATGHTLVADDVVSLAEGPAGAPARVLPGLPQLKLWPEALEATLRDDPERLPRVHSSLAKRVKAVARREERGEALLPLRAIYVLAEGPEIDVRPLLGGAKFTPLIQHSYMRNLLRDTGASARNFEQCTSLAAAVPICQLARPLDLDALPDVAEAVSHHLTTLAPSPNEEVS